MRVTTVSPHKMVVSNIALRRSLRFFGMLAFVLVLPIVLATGAEAAAHGDDVMATTFSICAIDPETGECGVAVTTRVPEVGRLVPFVKAGVGAVATQALVRVSYGPEGLELLEQGLSPEETIKELLADDPQAESRQLGVIDIQGRTAVHTGRDNSAHANARTGKNYTVQGNLLTGPEVLDAVVESFEKSAGGARPLAERLLDALAAGQTAGGDKRTGRKQSAALVVADPRRRGPLGDHLSVNLHVAEHPTPVAELRRQYDTIRQALGYRSFSLIEGRDVVELKRMLWELGYFQPDAAEFPCRRDDPQLAVFDAEAADAVDRFRESQGLPTPKDGLGHGRGMVDRETIRALKAAYDKSRQKKSEKTGDGA